MNYFFNPFEVSEDGPHQRPHHRHHHPYGFDGFRVGPPQPFGPDAGFRRHEWGPLRHEGHHHLPTPWSFEAFGGRGGGFGGHHRGGRGGFGFHGRGHGHECFGPPGFFGPRGWDFQPSNEEYSSDSSSEEEKNPKFPEEIVISDSSDVECMEKDGKQKEGRCRRRRCGRKGGDGCRRGRFGKHGRPDGFYGRRFGRRGRCPWKEAEESNEEVIHIEDVAASDFHIIQDDITAEISNLQLQPDEQGKKSNKKCFKVALNVDGFKRKDFRIRRNSNFLLIEGKQNAETQLGTFQRSFAYKITIPAGIDPKKVKVKLGNDGILRIKAKKSRETNSSGEEIEAEEEIVLDE
jgi:hypothetical protein